eukprot:scaffold34330_cov160-Skeletonema_menzelii.AAC.2
MKINIITTLLFTLHASAASGYAYLGNCDDYNIHTDQDCDAKCTELSAGRWTGNRRGPPNNITECSCTLQASRQDIRNGLPTENHWTCTRAKTPEPKPEPNPVTITENCKERDIKTFADCKAECSTLAAGRGLSVRINGDVGNISACLCTYGRNRDSSFTCHRDPQPIPEKRSGMCSDSDIYDQVTCSAFCQNYQRWAQYVSNANGLLWCRCQRGQGGKIDFECKGDQDSYLRSG